MTWPALLMLFFAVMHGAWLVAGRVMSWLQPGSSLDLHVRVTSGPGLIALLLVPPLAFVLCWALLRRTRRPD